MCSSRVDVYAHACPFFSLTMAGKQRWQPNNLVHLDKGNTWVGKGNMKEPQLLLMSESSPNLL